MVALSLFLKLAIASLSLLLISPVYAVPECFTVRASGSGTDIDNLFMTIKQNSTGNYTTTFSGALTATIFTLDADGFLTATNGPGVFQAEDFPLIPAGAPDSPLQWYTASEFETSPANEIQPSCTIDAGTKAFTCQAGGLDDFEVCYASNSVYLVTNQLAGCHDVVFTAVSANCPVPSPQPPCFAIQVSVPTTSVDGYYVDLLDTSTPGFIESGLVQSLSDAATLTTTNFITPNLVSTIRGNTSYYAVVAIGYSQIIWETVEQYNTFTFGQFATSWHFDCVVSAPNMTCTYGQAQASLFYTVCSDLTLRETASSLPALGCVMATISAAAVACPAPVFPGYSAPASTVTSTVSLPVTSSSVLTTTASPTTTTTGSASLPTDSVVSSISTASTVSVLPSSTPVPSSSTPIIPPEIASSSTATVPAATSHAANANIGTSHFVGCIGSLSDFHTFSLQSSSLLMTNELCISSCAGFVYSATQGSDCFCAMTLDTQTGVNFSGNGQTNGTCNIPCPGDAFEFCGGLVTSPTVRRDVSKRQTLVGILLTLYLNAAVVPPVSSSSTTLVSIASTSITPVTPVVTPIYNFGDIYITVATVIYIDICLTCASGLTTITTTTTLTNTACGCTSDTILPTCPMSTTTKQCPVCGPSGSPTDIVVTVPAIPSPTCLTGTCNNAHSGMGGGGSSSSNNNNNNSSYANPRPYQSSAASKTPALASAIAGLATLLLTAALVL